MTPTTEYKAGPTFLTFECVLKFCPVARTGADRLDLMTHLIGEEIYHGINPHFIKFYVVLTLQNIILLRLANQMKNLKKLLPASMYSFSYSALPTVHLSVLQVQLCRPQVWQSGHRPLRRGLQEVRSTTSPPSRKWRCPQLEGRF